MNGRFLGAKWTSTNWESIDLDLRVDALLHRRERRRQINVDLLRYQMAGAAGRRPHSFGGSSGAQLRALVEALVGPDVQEARHRAGHRRHGGEYRRDFHAAGHRLAPRGGGRLEAVRLEHITTYLVARAEFARLQRRDEVEWNVSVHRHGDDAFADAKRIGRIERCEAGIERCGGIDRLADDQDLIDRADVGIPAR